MTFTIVKSMDVKLTKLANVKAARRPLIVMGAFIQTAQPIRPQDSAATLYAFSALTPSGAHRGTFRARGFQGQSAPPVGAKLQAISVERSWPAEVIEVSDKPGDAWVQFRSDCSAQVKALTNQKDVSVVREARATGLQGLRGAGELYSAKFGWNRCYLEDGKIEYRFIPEPGVPSTTDPAPGFLHKKNEPFMLLFRGNELYPKVAFGSWS